MRAGERNTASTAQNIKAPKVDEITGAGYGWRGEAQKQVLRNRSLRLEMVRG